VLGSVWVCYSLSRDLTAHRLLSALAHVVTAGNMVDVEDYRSRI
jgi:hypothetical protein